MLHHPPHVFSGSADMERQGAQMPQEQPWTAADRPGPPGPDHTPLHGSNHLYPTAHRKCKDGTEWVAAPWRHGSARHGDK